MNITIFESYMMEFKDKFSCNYDLANRKLQTAIKEIDETIKHLEKTKYALLSLDKNLRLANNKAQDLSIKNLQKINQLCRKNLIILIQKMFKKFSIC